MLINSCARYIFDLLIADDITIWSKQLCRPEVLSICCSWLTYDWGSFTFTSAIGHAVVGIYTHHGLLGQMYVRSADGRGCMIMPDVPSRG